MKVFIFSLLFSFSMISSLGTKNLQLQVISSALSKGDAETIGKYLDKNVELVLPDIEDFTSATTALKHLKSFFSENPVDSYSQIHEGNSPDKLGFYLIGSMKSNRKSYRIYVYSKGSDRPIIQELRIELE